MFRKKSGNNRQIFQIVGFMYGSVGVIVFLLNIVSSIRNNRAMSPFNAMYILIGIVLILLSITKKSSLYFPLRKRRIAISIKRLSCLIQFFIMLVICAASILTDHSDQYNLPMLLMAGLMGLKYQILGKKTLIIFIAAFAVLFEVSAAIAGVYMRGFYIILFSAFFYGIIIIMYQEDLKRHFNLAKKYHDKLLRLEQIIEKFKGETVDISTINFTPRELEILKELCLTHPTNQELADTMGVKVQTIKTHIRNIFDKSGVDDRYQLIDLFKYNFPKE
ncbi:MAG: helix-turn-helix transcriptional regulator [Spirochaetia bacterium]|nr:helix-turn-helix transcriptional regulator [Spirochaetia bacterium]